MSEEGKMSSPHYGIPGFDPEARISSELQLNEKEQEEEYEKKAIYEKPNGASVELNPDIKDWNYKWFNGEIHTSPWGAEQSPYKGESKQRVKVAMQGKKLNPTKRNGIASVFGTVIAVLDEEDRKLIGESGWWRVKDLSKTVRRRGKI
jgi:hypothetical protein